MLDLIPIDKVLLLSVENFGKYLTVLRLEADRMSFDMTRLDRYTTMLTKEVLINQLGGKIV